MQKIKFLIRHLKFGLFCLGIASDRKTASENITNRLILDLSDWVKFKRKTNANRDKVALMAWWRLKTDFGGNIDIELKMRYKASGGVKRRRKTSINNFKWKKEKNMICSECGKEIEGEDVYYCPKCGKTLCGECNDASEGICPMCNRANTMMYN